MKTIVKSTLVLLAFLAFTSVNAQDKAATPDAAVPAKSKHPDMSSWAELKAFHQVMSSTFHPAEEGNLKPIKERSGELYDKAVALEKSNIPDAFNTPDIVAATKELTAKSKSVNDLVKSNATDEKITAELTAAHDSFHKIVGLCRPGNDHHDEKK